MSRLHFGQRPFQRRLSGILKRGPVSLDTSDYSTSSYTAN